MPPSARQRVLHAVDGRRRCRRAPSGCRSCPSRRRRRRPLAAICSSTVAGGKRADGQQGAGRDLARAAAAPRRRRSGGDAVGRAPGVERRVGAAARQRRRFARAVAQHHVGLDAQRDQQLVHRHAADEHRLGADVHVVHALLELPPALGVDLAAREHDVGARSAPAGRS